MSLKQGQAIMSLKQGWETGCGKAKQAGGRSVVVIAFADAMLLGYFASIESFNFGGVCGVGKDPYACRRLTATSALHALTSLWNGSLRMSRSVDFWYLRISRSATVPGR